MSRTTLDFEYNGKDYSLAFNIDIVKQLDRSGLLAQIGGGERPLTMTEDLFVASFETNHPRVTNRQRQEIFQEFSETSEDGSLLEILFEMISEVREEMTPKGNVKWRVSRE